MDLGWEWRNDKPANDLSRTTEVSVPSSVEYGILSFLQKEAPKRMDALASGLGIRTESLACCGP